MSALTDDKQADAITSQELSPFGTFTWTSPKRQLDDDEENRVGQLYRSPETTPERQMQLPKPITLIETAATEEREIVLENSTSARSRPIEVDEEFKAIFAAAKEEVIEDGMESEFFKRLEGLIRWYGALAFDTLTHLIVDEQVNIEVASEALSLIGQIDDSSSHLLRRRFLERCLLHSRFARVRYGAVLGLAYIDDPKSIHILELAIKQETVQSLKQDISWVLTQLETTMQENA